MNNNYRHYRISTQIEMIQDHLLTAAGHRTHHDAHEKTSDDETTLRGATGRWWRRNAFHLDRCFPAFIDDQDGVRWTQNRTVRMRQVDPMRSISIDLDSTTSNGALRRPSDNRTSVSMETRWHHSTRSLCLPQIFFLTYILLLTVVYLLGLVYARLQRSTLDWNVVSSIASSAH